MTLNRPATVVLALALGPAAAGAQSRWQRQVETHLAGAAATLTAAGYVPVRLFLTGALDNGETASDTVTLAGGAAYVVLGVCDDDCAALELGLLAANGYEVDAARRSGNAPIVRVTPRETMRYRVTIRMTGCGMNPCWYGLRIFRRPTP
jgi:hypothetical protein